MMSYKNSVIRTAKIIAPALFLLLVISSVTASASEAGIAIFKNNPSSNGAEYADTYAKAMNYKNPSVSSFALLRVSPKNSGNYSTAQACDLWDFVNKEWRIISDPRGPDYISSAPGTIRAGLRGDSDDYSVFLASSIMSLGGRCRIVAATDSGDNTWHTYPEVFIGYGDDEAVKILKYTATRYDCEKIFYSITDESGMKGYWMNLDWAIQRYYGPRYYAYGSTKAEIEAYHPGRVYFPADSATFYYADGRSDKQLPAYGYYQRTKFGTDTLNEI
ncbi:MAG: hypothetical protein PHP13_00255 [Methanomicrobium sp.]|nr:hypothetical protein [Methanomicrobium sp.]